VRDAARRIEQQIRIRQAQRQEPVDREAIVLRRFERRSGADDAFRDCGQAARKRPMSEGVAPPPSGVRAHRRGRGGEECEQ
jgi:hypothetical protein